MITVYKKKIKGMELIRGNDIYFNQNTVMHLNEKAKTIIHQIDQSEMLGSFQIKSRFDGSVLNIDKLSTGCKTALNILYNPDKVFDIRECGDNALSVIYSLPQGNVFCEYPYISFDMTCVNICDKKGVRKVCSYEELKEWWTSED